MLLYPLQRKLLIHYSRERERTESALSILNVIGIELTESCIQNAPIFYLLARQEPKQTKPVLNDD